MEYLVRCNNCKHEEDNNGECDVRKMYVKCLNRAECKYVNDKLCKPNNYSLFEPLDNIKQHYKLKENEMEYLVDCENCKHDGNCDDDVAECWNNGECKYINRILDDDCYSLFEPLDRIKQHYTLKKQNIINPKLKSNTLKQTEIHWKEINNKIKIVDIKNCLTLEEADAIKGVDYRYLQEDEFRYYWATDKNYLFLYDQANNLYKLKIDHEYEIQYFIKYVDNMKKAGIRMGEILKYKRELSNKVNITKI